MLYDEQLNTENLDNACRFLQNTNTLIIEGTSLKVFPAYQLIYSFVRDNFIVLNKEETSLDEWSDIVLHDDLSEIFSKI